MDLAQILTGISDYVTQVGDNKDSAKTALQNNADLRQQGIESLAKAGELSTKLAVDDLQQQLVMESRKKATAAAFQTDILDPDNRIAILARQQAAELDAALTQSRRASELNNMNIFDSPLEYLVARPFAHRNAKEAEAATTRYNLLDKAIGDLNKQTQSTIKTQEAINEQLTVDEIGRRAQLAELQAGEAVRAAKMAANQAYVNDLKTLQSFDEEQLRYTTEAYKLSRHEQEFNARMEEMKANREARAAIKRTAEENLQYQFQRYNIGAELTGKQKAVNISDFQAIEKLNKKAVADIISVGENAYIDPSTGRVTGQIERTPGESAVTLGIVQGRLPQSAERVSSLLYGNMSLAQQELRKQGGKITADDLANQVNRQLNGAVVTKNGKTEKVTGTIDLMAGDMEQDFAGNKNIFRAPDVQTMATVNPALAKNPMWKQIVEPATAADGPSPTVDSMLRQAIHGIREKTVTPEQASQFISSYFGAALVTNGVNEQYQKVGIAQPKSYPVLVTNRAGYGENKIDASNEQELRRYLAANPKFARSFNPFGGL